MLQGWWQSRCSLDHKNILHIQRSERRAAHGGRTIAWCRRRRLSRLSHHGHPDNQELENNARYDTQQRHFSSYPEPLPSLCLIVIFHWDFLTTAPYFVYRFRGVFRASPNSRSFSTIRISICDNNRCYSCDLRIGRRNVCVNVEKNHAFCHSNHRITLISFCRDIDDIR